MTDAIRSGLPPHIAAKICGHQQLDTTMGYAAIYPEDVISHHRAFIARRRADRPSEEYRDLSTQEWDEFLAHFELRKVALGSCGRDFGTPCAHENACVRCPLLRVDPAQRPRLEEIRGNLVDRLQEAKDQGWLGEVAAIETTLAAANQKLDAMRSAAAKGNTHLGIPSFRSAVRTVGTTAPQIGAPSPAPADRLTDLTAGRKRSRFVAAVHWPDSVYTDQKRRPIRHQRTHRSGSGRTHPRPTPRLPTPPHTNPDRPQLRRRQNTPPPHKAKPQVEPLSTALEPATSG